MAESLLFFLPHLIFKRVCYDNCRPICCFSFGKTSEAIYFGVLEFFMVVNVAITSFSYLSIVKGRRECIGTIEYALKQFKQNKKQMRRGES